MHNNSLYFHFFKRISHDVKDEDGYIAFHYAADKNIKEADELLFSDDANINETMKKDKLLFILQRN